MSETRRRRLRFAAWMGLPALVVMRVAAELTRLPYGPKLALSDTLVYFLPMALAVAAGAVLTLRTLGTGLEPRFWGLLTGAVSIVLVVEVHWTYYAATIDPHGPPMLHPVRALLILAVALFFALAVTMTRYGEEPLSARLRFYTDVAAGMAALFVPVYLGWTLPLFMSAEGVPIVGATVAAVTWLVGFAIAAAVLAIILGWKAYRWRSWERIVAASMLVFAAGLVTMPLWYAAMAESDAMQVPWTTLVLGAGQYLLFVAAVYRLTAPAQEALDEPWPVPAAARGWPGRLYPVLLAIVLPFVVWEALRLVPLPESDPVVFAAVTLAALLVVRSWLAEFERAQLARRAISDPLTGVFGRRHFLEELEHAISRASHRSAMVSLVIADIDDFSRVNNLYGHDTGDAALVLLARTLSGASEGEGSVYRIGGDEFGVVFENAAPADAGAWARGAYGLVRRAFDDAELPAVSVSLGVAGFPVHALDVEGLVEAAHLARMRARLDDGVPVAVYPHDHSPEAGERVDPSRTRERTLRHAVHVLAQAVDARSESTKAHSRDVAELATTLARVLGLSEERVQVVGLAALMHDVGEVGVGESVLAKPGPLDAEETIEMRRHAELGERILAAAHLDEIAPAVRHHHERWDGTGYPDGLAGEHIPLEARILAVCDAFEAMTAGRPYQPSRSVADALAEVGAAAGTQFDPAVAAAFVRTVRGLAPAASTPRPERPSFSPQPETTG